MNYFSFFEKTTRYVLSVLVNKKYRLRPAMRFVYEHYKNNGGVGLVGVELGVFRGDHAAEMLKILPIKKLYLVDSYAPYVDDRGYHDHSGFKDDCLNRFKGDSRVVFLHMTSGEALKYIPDGLDFVYSDNEHSVDGVNTDLLYWDKLRVGGVFSGDDYGLKYFSVGVAVGNFLLSHPEIKRCDRQSSGVEYWFVKKEG